MMSDSLRIRRNRDRENDKKSVKKSTHTDVGHYGKLNRLETLCCCIGIPEQLDRGQTRSLHAVWTPLAGRIRTARNCKSSNGHLDATIIGLANQILEYGEPQRYLFLCDW